MSGEAPQGAQAVLRAVSLLKAFRPDRPHLSLGRLSALTGLTRATTHRLAAALESEGLLARHPSDNTYHLGPMVIAMGSMALLSSDLRQTVRPALESLVAQSGETATLEVLTGDRMLILDGIPGKHLVSAGLDIGTHWPAHLCATGRAIMALLDEAELAQVLPDTPAGGTDKAPRDAAAVRSALVDVRVRGYAAVREELEPDYVAVAAAFTDALGRVEGAVCVGGPRSRLNERRIRELGPLLAETARRLSQRHEMTRGVGDT